MTAQDRSGWLTVPAMARRLGVSEANLKRRIRDGKPLQVAPGQYVEIETEMIERPQGHEWRVRVRGDMPAISTDQPPADSEDVAPLRGDQGQSRALDILDALLRANAETMERQAAQIQHLTERAVRAEATAEAHQAAWEQSIIDLGEQTERAIRAEAERDAVRAENEALRQRRWWQWW